MTLIRSEKTRGVLENIRWAVTAVFIVLMMGAIMAIVLAGINGVVSPPFYSAWFCAWIVGMLGAAASAVWWAMWD